MPSVVVDCLALQRRDRAADASCELLLTPPPLPAVVVSVVPARSPRLRRLPSSLAVVLGLLLVVLGRALHGRDGTTDRHTQRERP